MSESSSRAGPTFIGADSGGTFTDLVALEQGRIRVHKLPTTPDDPAPEDAVDLRFFKEQGTLVLSNESGLHLEYSIRGTNMFGLPSSFGDDIDIEEPQRALALAAGDYTIEWSSDDRDDRWSSMRFQVRAGQTTRRPSR